MQFFRGFHLENSSVLWQLTFCHILCLLEMVSLIIESTSVALTEQPNACVVPCGCSHIYLWTSCCGELHTCFCVLSGGVTFIHSGQPILFFFNFYFLILESKGRKTLICCSTYLCIHRLILVRVLTGNQTCSLEGLG